MINQNNKTKSSILNMRASSEGDPRRNFQKHPPAERRRTERFDESDTRGNSEVETRSFENGWSSPMLAGAARASRAPLKRQREAESAGRGRRKRMLKLRHDGGRDESRSGKITRRGWEMEAGGGSRESREWTASTLSSTRTALWEKRPWSVHEASAHSDL